MIEIGSDLNLILQSKAPEFIMNRVHSWQDGLSSFFEEFEEYANVYRLLDTKSRTRANAFTQTTVGETIRATEALTTSIYRMLTSADPCYEPVSLNWEKDSRALEAAHVQLRYQDHKLRWQRRLLRAVRGTTLFGTAIVETPWIQHSRFGKILYEGLGFTPRSLLQCAFDPNVFYIDESSWVAFLDYYTKDQLLDLAEIDPEHWNPYLIQECLEEGGKAVDSKVQMRRQRAGYKDNDLYEICTYYGRIREIPREDGRLWVVRVMNGSKPIAAYGNPSPTGNLPIKVARYVDFEMEPYGYGVGRLGRLAQRHLDENRKMYMDVARMGLMNMWIKDRMSGIRNSDLKIKPLGIIEADDINKIKPYSPDLNQVNLGMKLEEIYKMEHQGNTGATPNLQAAVTDASATEASIAQNEAIRRVAVIAEDIADSLIREYQQEKHDYNAAWLQTDMFLSLPGMQQPVRANRMTIEKDLEIFVRITTDKDFRPKRLERIERFLQFATSVRNQIPRNIDLGPVFEEWTRALDLPVHRVVLPLEPVPQPTAAEGLAERMRKSQQVAQEFGDEANAVMDEGGVPEMNVESTPVGGVLATP
jgi:hypothetical protein